ncbi:hypothetical protein OROMI_024125 [Orobanche minor]
MITNLNTNPADISKKKRRTKGNFEEESEALLKHDFSENKRGTKGKFVKESEESREDWFRYLDDVEKNECFEVGDYPHIDLSGLVGYPMVQRVYDLSHTDENLEDDMLLYLSKLAICFYNIREGTCFCDVKVVMATESGVKRDNYHITFHAFLTKSKRNRVAVTFQAHIVVYFVCPYPKFEIMFVRIKPSESDQNKSKNSQQGQPSESDHDKDQIYQHRLSQVIQDSPLDSQYSLALYLCQYALFSYNFSTLSGSVAKHDIESLKVVELTKPVAEIPTYLITYEAPLRPKAKGKNVDTFKIEICMPSLFPTTVIEFKSEVRVNTVGSETFGRLLEGIGLILITSGTS